MLLTEKNKEEAIKVLRALEVDESTLKYIKCTDEDCWLHKFEHDLGGRDGWSSLLIDRGPDYECLDPEEDELVEVDGVQYLIHEGD